MIRKVASLFSSENRKLDFAMRWALLFAIFFICALLVCGLLADNVEKSFLSHARNAQFTDLERARETVSEWQENILGKIRIIRELDELKAIPLEVYNSPDAERMLNPDYLRSTGEESRQMAATLADARTALEEIVQQPPWIYASLLPLQGASIASAGAIPPFQDEKDELTTRSMASGRVEFGLPVQIGKTLAIPVCVPVFARNSTDPKPSAFLLLAAQADTLAHKIASDHGKPALPVSILIIFQSGSKFSMVINDADKPAMVPIANPPLSISKLAFGQRNATAEDEKVYSSGIALKNPPLLLLAETPVHSVMPAIKVQWIKIYVLGFLLCLSLSLCVAWLQTTIEAHKSQNSSRRMADLSDRVANQKALLDSINSSLGIGLLILGADGKVRMGNQAFLDICGNSGEINRGASLEDYLPSDIAQTILKDLRIVNDARHCASMELTLPPAGEEKTSTTCRISLSPSAEDGNGGVALFQDITRMREESKISRERQLALISALARAIESIDPNLVGHSDKLENVSALLAQALRLEENERETLRLASRLSQVGKLFVPRDLLLKKGKLTPEELAEVRRAPEYGDKILSTLHFDLPVRETAAMIGEKLDGSGKPNGLMGEEISIMGRILAVANAFIAMTSPRAWRNEGSMQMEDAIAHLRAEEGFDQHVVNTLASLPVTRLAEALGQKNSNTGN